MRQKWLAYALWFVASLMFLIGIAKGSVTLILFGGVGILGVTFFPKNNDK